MYNIPKNIQLTLTSLNINVSSILHVQQKDILRMLKDQKSFNAFIFDFSILLLEKICKKRIKFCEIWMNITFLF